MALLISLSLMLGVVFGKGTLDINAMLIASGLFAVADSIRMLKQNKK